MANDAKSVVSARKVRFHWSDGSNTFLIFALFGGRAIETFQWATPSQRTIDKAGSFAVGLCCKSEADV